MRCVAHLGTHSVAARRRVARQRFFNSATGDGSAAKLRDRTYQAQHRKVSDIHICGYSLERGSTMDARAAIYCQPPPRCIANTITPVPLDSFPASGHVALVPGLVGEISLPVPRGSHSSCQPQAEDGIRNTFSLPLARYRLRFARQSMRTGRDAERSSPRSGTANMKSAFDVPLMLPCDGAARN